MRNAISRGVWALFLVGSAGCGNGIAGDWFRCQSAACEVLTDDGLRFGDGGEFVGLETTGSTLDPDEEYCESLSTSMKGRYEFDGTRLTTTPEGGAPETVDFAIEEDRASLSRENEVSTWQRIEPRSLGPCAPNRLQ